MPPSQEVLAEAEARVANCACPGCAVTAAVDEALELWRPVDRVRFMEILVAQAERLADSLLEG